MLQQREVLQVKTQNAPGQVKVQIIPVVKVHIIPVVPVPGACSHPKHVVELEVDKLEHGLVELEEGDHDTVVHVHWQHLGQLVGHEPRHGLAEDLSLHE